MKYKGFDVFDVTVGDGDFGIKRTSLVALPAMESAFLYFGKDNAQFKFADEEKGELIGAIMVPNKLIFRNIQNNKFWVNFTPEVIKELTGKMITDGTAGLFSVMHDGQLNEGAVEVQEIWIKETDNDKSVDFGINEEVGTAFIKVKVNNENIKKAIKDNGLNGFSIELDASLVEKSELFNKVVEPKKEPLMKITDVFTNSIEVNGVKLYFNAELTKNNYIVSEVDDKPAPYSGEFTYEDTKFIVTEGVITEKIDIKLSIEEMVKKLSDKFEASETAAKVVADGKKEIEDREEELELLKTQFSKDKEVFEKSKIEKKEVKLNLSKSMTDNQSVGREWMKQFSNNNK